VQPPIALEIFGLVRRLFTEGAADVLAECKYHIQNLQVAVNARI
jgi:hypothetical protein